MAPSWVPNYGSWTSGRPPESRSSSGDRSSTAVLRNVCPTASDDPSHACSVTSTAGGEDCYDVVAERVPQ
jgi:hypothetical protein